MNCSHVVPSYRLQIFRTDCFSVDIHRVTGLARKSAPAWAPLHGLPGASFCTGSPLHPKGTSTCQGVGLPMGCSVGTLRCRKRMCFPTGCRESLLWHLDYFLPSPSLICVSAQFFSLPFFPHSSLSQLLCSVFHPFFNLLSERHHQGC